MASWRKILVSAALLPTLAAAADPAMLELIMPDARFVMDINVARMASSPIGHSISAQMKDELQKGHPDLQQSMAALGSVDWTRYVQEVLLAGNGQGGKEAPMLAIVRGQIDPAWIESFKGFQGAKSTYLGVPMVASSKENTVIAFLDGSMAIAGPEAVVKAAIRRRGQDTPRSTVVADGLKRFDGHYDAWIVTAGAMGGAAGSPAAGGMKWPDRLEALTAGLSLSPDLEISADLTMRTEKDVADMANAMRWFTGALKSQAQGASGLDKMNVKTEGKHLSFSLHVPEKEVLAALAQRQQTLAAQSKATTLHPPGAPKGAPNVPAGSIMIQSSPSDMGTVVIPVKPQ